MGGFFADHDFDILFEEFDQAVVHFESLTVEVFKIITLIVSEIKNTDLEKGN